MYYPSSTPKGRCEVSIKEQDISNEIWEEIFDELEIPQADREEQFNINGVTGVVTKVESLKTDFGKEVAFGIRIDGDSSEEKVKDALDKAWDSAMKRGPIN